MEKDFEISPYLGGKRGECLCCNGDYHVYGVKDEGKIDEFIHRETYEMVKRGVRRVRVSIQEITCKHIVTQGREGETGSWCLECGEKVLEVETRACKDCVHCRPFEFLTQTLVSIPPFCEKKKMHVLDNLHVTYHVSEGTCFEGKTDDQNCI